LESISEPSVLTANTRDITSLNAAMPFVPCPIVQTIGLVPHCGGGIRIYSYLVNIHGGGIYRLAYTPISTPFQ